MWNEYLSYSRDGASHIIDRLSATPQLCTQLMYGSGLRVGTFYDFIPSLKQQIGSFERQLASDADTGKAGVYLPNALATKWPNAQYELRWQ